jgi:hypothetical protein
MSASSCPVSGDNVVDRRRPSISMYRAWFQIAATCPTGVLTTLSIARSLAPLPPFR